MGKNTTPGLYGESEQDLEFTKEEILMGEKDILDGLIQLGGRRDEAENYGKIRLKDAKGNVKLEFRIRPLTEEETKALTRQATSMPKNKNEKEIVDWVKYRSLLIYTATIDEDREKIWDNKKAMEHYDAMQGWELVDKIMFLGEKVRTLRVLDKISEIGFEEVQAEEQAKN